MSTRVLIFQTFKGRSQHRLRCYWSRHFAYTVLFNHDSHLTRRAVIKPLPSTQHTWPLLSRGGSMNNQVCIQKEGSMFYGEQHRRGIRTQHPRANASYEGLFQKRRLCLWAWSLLGNSTSNIKGSTKWICSDRRAIFYNSSGSLICFQVLNPK